MKANELMIGDWVNYSNNPKIIKGAIDFTFAKDFEPIPLTAEILEKNGLQMGENRFDDTNDIPFPSPTKIIIRHDEFLEYKVDVWHLSLVHHETYIMDGGYMHIKFCYVHELQHALRLIGLKELANNFKV